jgi:hypothetical protein
MDKLTDAEKALLAKTEEQKLKHKEAQARYRAKLNKDKIKEYNKSYFEKKRQKVAEVVEKIAAPNPDDKIPSFKTRKTDLTDTTILDYMRKAEVIQKLFHKNELTDDAKLELANLFLDEEFNEKLILNEMKFLSTDVDVIIQKLRLVYSNDNSFKSHINVLTVITSHFKSLPSKIYQSLSKIAMKTNEEVQIKRQDNILEDKDIGKIINLDKPVIMANLAKLDGKEDRLIYALYTLFASRRLDWRNMKVTSETDVTKLTDDNYLITSKPLQVVFNNYKTSKTYGQQVFEIEDEDLETVINDYISFKKLKDGEYLFHLMRSKHEPIKESHFSLKVSEVFFAVYDVKISVRFIRISWSNYINSQPISFNEKQKYIRRMAHSMTESQRYFKLAPVVSSP